MSAWSEIALFRSPWKRSEDACLFVCTKSLGRGDIWQVRENFWGNSQRPKLGQEKGSRKRETVEDMGGGRGFLFVARNDEWAWAPDLALKMDERFLLQHVTEQSGGWARAGCGPGMIGAKKNRDQEERHR